MASVSMTELRKQTERIVERVAAGETIEITHWGKTVATIKPVSPGAERLHYLIATMGDRWMDELDLPGEDTTLDRSISDRND